MIQLVPETIAPPLAHGDEHAFYEARVGRTIGAFVLLAIGVAFCLAPLAHPIGWLGAIPLGLPCLFVALVIARGVARGWKRRWWIVRVRRDEVWLRIRSYLNSDLPDTDAVVARLPRSAIGRVREVRERRDVPGASNGRTEMRFVRALEVTLGRDGTAALERALAEERTRSRRGRGHFGAYPVFVPTAGVVRVVFSSHTMALTPSLRRAIEALRRFSYPVADERLETHADWRRLSEDEIDAMVGACVAEGNEMQAIRLLRQRLGLDLASAKREVERRRPMTTA